MIVDALHEYHIDPAVSKHQRSDPRSWRPHYEAQGGVHTLKPLAKLPAVEQECQVSELIGGNRGH